MMVRMASHLGPGDRLAPGADRSRGVWTSFLMASVVNPRSAVLEPVPAISRVETMPRPHLIGYVVSETIRA
jgi:hypothetical protein